MKAFILCILCVFFLSSCSLGLPSQNLPSRFNTGQVSVNTGGAASKSYSGTPACERARGKVERANREINDSEDDADDYKKKVEKAEDEIDDLKDDLKEDDITDEKKAEINKEIEELKGDIDGYEKKQEREEDDVKDAEKDLRSAEYDIKREC